jgi:hypothetical protein
MGRSDNEEKGGHVLSLYMPYSDLGVCRNGGMYLGVGSEVGGARSEGLCVNSPVWEGGEVNTYLLP